MTARHATLSLCSPAETTALAHRFAQVLKAGDVVLLEGSVGAGKTHFARGVIEALLAVPEDIPSPTFTLVQTYDAISCEIWHADLYRLTSPDEVIELGLMEAFEGAICLIEWPDRLEETAPPDALTLAFSTSDDDDHRRLAVSWTSPRWDQTIKEAFYAGS